MKKTSRILITLMNIVLLITLITGATYALFTSEARVNTTVTSANVEIDVELTKFEVYSMDRLQPGNNFENGGSATVQADGTIELAYVTPGDKVVAHYSLENKSNIKINYSVTTTITGELAAGLVTNIKGSTGKWIQLEAGQSVEDIEVSIELPVSAGNEYQNKTASVLILIYAIQGNAEPEIFNVSQLQNELNNASTNPAQPTVLKLGADLKPTSSLAVKEGTYVQIDLNGNDITPAEDFSFEGAVQLIMIEKGASLTLVDSSNTKRYGYYEGNQYVISDTNKEGADVLVGGNISFGDKFSQKENIPAASQWKISTIRNLGNLTLDGVSIAGVNTAMGDGGAIYSGNTSDAELCANASLTIINSSICGNTSIGSGIIYTNNKLTIKNSLFSNNTSFNGGAVVARSTHAVTYVENTTFNHNVATVGAVMQLRAGASVEANHCNIFNNEAMDMTVEGAGSKTASGVVVHIMGNTKTSVIVNNCPIIGNKINGVEIVDINEKIFDLIALYTGSLNVDTQCVMHSILVQGADYSQIFHNYFAEMYKTPCRGNH